MRKNNDSVCRYPLAKAIAALFAIYLVLFAVFCILTAPNGGHVVYTTRTGECYHLSGCSSLKYSKFKTTIEDAVSDGYRKCGNCKPPSLIAEKANLEFSLSNIIEVFLVSILISLFVWYVSFYLFYFLGIEDSLIKFRWYLLSSTVFVFILFFV